MLVQCAASNFRKRRTDTHDLTKYDDELATRLAVQFYVQDVDLDRLRNLINEVDMTCDSIDADPVVTITFRGPTTDEDAWPYIALTALKQFA